MVQGTSACKISGHSLHAFSIKYLENSQHGQMNRQRDEHWPALCPHRDFVGGDHKAVKGKIWNMIHMINNLSREYMHNFCYDLTLWAPQERSINPATYLDAVFHLLWLYSAGDITIDPAMHYGTNQLLGGHKKVKAMSLHYGFMLGDIHDQSYNWFIYQIPTYMNKSKWINQRQ